MLTEIFSIQAEGSQPKTKLCTYILDHSQDIGINKRPLVLLCPGGGYEFTSDREAEPLAMRFLAMGCHAAVLRYSCSPSVYPTALLETAQCMKLIHSYAQEWNVDTNKIVIAGCSAGGHLAASLGTHWHEPWLAEQTGVKNEILRPAGMLLCYPVITSGEYAHEGSFQALLRGQDTKELREQVSLEKQVTKHTPRAFIWHTFTDDCVPAENALLMASAMKAHGISVELHLYPKGGHGLSACDEQTANPEGYGIQAECQSWLSLAEVWLKNL